jgi:hypothetical protein
MLPRFQRANDLLYELLLMRRSALGLLALLVACASPESRQALEAMQAGCNAGDPRACEAANEQAAANEQEADANAADWVLAILLLPLVIVTGVAGNDARHSWQHESERRQFKWQGER